MISVHVTLVIIAPVRIECNTAAKRLLCFIRTFSFHNVRRAPLVSRKDLKKKKKRDFFFYATEIVFLWKRNPQKINNQIFRVNKPLLKNLLNRVLVLGVSLWLFLVFVCIFFFLCLSLVLILCVTWCFAVLKLSIGVYTSAFGKLVC